MSRSQELQLIRDAISATESSLNMVKSLVNQLERGAGDSDYRPRNDMRSDVRSDSRGDFHRDVRSDIRSKPYVSSVSEAPKRASRVISEKPRVEKKQFDSVSTEAEITGIFDGKNMVGGHGENYPVPANYIAKSLIVTGDTLKVVKEDGENKFKQIRRVKRNRIVGVLSKKDGEFVVVTEAGSYKVLDEAISHLKVKEGGNLVVLIPSEGKAQWAAVEGIATEESENKSNEELKSVEKVTPQEVEAEMPVSKVEVSEPVAPEVVKVEEITTPGVEVLPVEVVTSSDTAPVEPITPVKKPKKDEADEEALQ